MKTVEDIKDAYGTFTGPFPFALGTKVKATAWEIFCFFKGAEGVVAHVDADGDVWVDFGNNSFDEDETIWTVTHDKGDKKGSHCIEVLA